MNGLAESLGRPGLLGVVGQTLEKKFTAQLKQYFVALASHVRSMKLEQLVLQLTPEIARHTAELRLSRVLRTSAPVLKGILQQNIYDGMLQADKIHHLAEADASDPNASTQYLTGEEAALYASIRAGELIAGLNETTRMRIADAIELGITDRLGVDGTARLIRAALADMSAKRARTIASTEMNDAFSEATMRKLDRMGVTYKVWITAGACCDECAENEDAGPIPIDDDFPSGDDRPPGHPNCRCAVSGAQPPQLQAA